MNIVEAKKVLADWLSERVKNLFGEQFEPEIAEPENPDFGDLTTNVAFSLAKSLKKPPKFIAEKIVEADIPEFIEKAQVVGGYINFWLSKRFLVENAISAINDDAHWGKTILDKVQRINLEFVSANPTGPLNVVSARAAAVGSTLANLLIAIGHDVTTEYYINDAGNQIKLLGESFRARIAQLKGEHAEIPEDGYHGEYLIDYAKEYIEKNPSETPDEWIVKRIIKEQMETLRIYNTYYDVMFSEREFRESGKVEEVLKRLGESGLTYEKDSALWFSASKLRDDVEDFVLVRSNGEWTYGLVDLAYHANKFEERGFEKVINILGPDHHGHKARLEAGMKALGHDGKLSVLILQQVNLVEDNVKVKMSKRAGKLVTMKELIEDIGVDAARYFFLARRMEAHLDFDLNLARTTTEENPVYYIQYAHARIKSILRFAKNKGLDKNENDAMIISKLAEPEEVALLRKMVKFPLVVFNAANILAPHLIPFYLLDFSKLFHNFYTKHRVVGEDRDKSIARLVLCKAVGVTIKNGLSMCGISAPEQM